MAMTSVDLPPDLVSEVKRITGQTTVRGAITAALEQTVSRDRQVRALAALRGREHLADLRDPDVLAAARR